MLRNRFERPLTIVLAILIMGVAETSSSVAWAQGDFYLKEGDRVVFYGDSITDQRLYTTFVETYVLTRFPRLNVRFVHSGWGGDRVTGGGGGPIDVRLKRDVIAYQPTVMTIMLGMNDGGYQAFDDSLFKTYTDGYKHILQTMRAALPGIRVTLIQPSPYDDVTRAPMFPGGYNAVLVRYGDFVKELGKSENMTVTDMDAPVVTALEKAKASDPERAAKIVPDRVHPGAGGHLVMAQALLEAWKAPAMVSAVEIDAVSKRVVRAENTAVTGIDSARGLSWTQTDNALPMPVNLKDPVVALAVSSSHFVQTLDQQPLQVAGLAAPRYTLKIDGEEIGVFSKEQLGAGVNLAELSTPMARQAAAVHDLTLKHNTLHYARWRQVQVPLEGDSLPHAQAALSDLDSLEAEVIDEQLAAAQPKPRHYELVPQ